MKTITCTNGAGETAVFPAGLSDGPFVLEDATGVLEARADLFTADGALSDGTVWQGSRMQKRNIVLTLRDRPNSDHAANRARLLSVFRFKQAGTLTFTNENGEDRLIEYVVESVTADVKKRSHSYQISLLCPSPFWLSAEDSTGTIGGTRNLFSFPHTFPEAGEEFSARNTVQTLEIENAGAADGIGLTVVLSAEGGEVRNPAVTHLQSGAKMEIGSPARPLTIVPDNPVTIETGRGKKRIRSAAGENLVSYLTEESDFLTVRSGMNSFTVTAEYGLSSLVAVFSWRMTYEGA